MKNHFTPISKDLDLLRVQKPCPKKWAEMTGSDQKRFCEHCSLHVHNLSAMSPRQIKTLAQTPGRRCVAYFEREDGKIRIRSRFEFLHQSFSLTRRLAASLLALLFPFSFISCSPKSSDPSTTLSAPQPSAPTETPMLMGKPVSLPQPPSPQETQRIGDSAAANVESEPLPTDPPVVPETSPAPPIQEPVTLGMPHNIETKPVPPPPPGPIETFSSQSKTPGKMTVGF